MSVVVVVTPGSAQVACVLVEQLAATGVIAQTTTFDRESDYASVIDAGIPSAGVWSGDSNKKSRKQARRWGGRAGNPSTRTTTPAATASTSSTTARSTASPAPRPAPSPSSPYPVPTKGR
ncbi:MAG TPA: hypothetical protein VFN87_16375 [Solirubrobacteraceae bacterium]|nr:hypothetical protein [Solirubrobacteraceae bacterium]